MRRPYPFDQLARGVLAVLYVWFGALKIFGVSPASALVSALGDRMTGDGSPTMVVVVGIAEVVIGLSFLSPKLTRLSLALFTAHIIVVSLPLILLPELTWQSPFVPTMEGQYIIKNLALVALAVVVAKTKTK